MKNKFNILSVIALLFLAFSGIAQDKVATVKLVETPRQFETKSLELKPGKYQFDISNKDVDHEVAFFLQKESDKGSKEFSTALANSGLSKTLKKGESGKTGVVELEKGTYVYSCPLNPTPHYIITVK